METKRLLALINEEQKILFFRTHSPFGTKEKWKDTFPFLSPPNLILAKVGGRKTNKWGMIWFNDSTLSIK